MCEKLNYIYRKGHKEKIPLQTTTERESNMGWAPPFSLLVDKAQAVHQGDSAPIEVEDDP